MKDVVSAEVLSALSALCPDGGYVIVSAGELKKRSKALSRLSGKELEELFALLEREGYVSLRYSDGEEFCVSLLDNSRYDSNAFTGKSVEAKAKRARFYEKNEGNYFLKLCLPSFFGGAVGGIIGGVIAFVIARAMG